MFSGGCLLSHSFQQHLLDLGHTSGASHQNHLLNFILQTGLKELDPQQQRSTYNHWIGFLKSTLKSDVIRNVNNLLDRCQTAKPE